MSFSATVALCAASLDKRARLCIATCPYVDVRPAPEKLSQVLAKCIKDREPQQAGNPPMYLPMLTEAGKNPAGLHLQPTAKELEMIFTAHQRGAAQFENKSTLERYYKFLTWTPEDIMKLLPPTPVLFIVPEQHTSSPPEKQLALYEALGSPKQILMVAGKGHLTLFAGGHFDSLMQAQVEFLRNVFEGKIA